MSHPLTDDVVATTETRTETAAKPFRFLPLLNFLTRIALGLAFLSAVADRVGWWGPAGTTNVAWGGYHAYRDYVAYLAPYLHGTLLDLASWGATIVESVIGVTLVVGLFTRTSAWISTLMLLVFAVSMLVFAGAEAPFSYSVFSAAMASAYLALAPRATQKWGADQILLAGRRP